LLKSIVFLQRTMICYTSLRIKKSNDFEVTFGLFYCVSDTFFGDWING